MPSALILSHMDAVMPELQPNSCVCHMALQVLAKLPIVSLQQLSGVEVRLMAFAGATSCTREEKRRAADLLSRVRG